VVALRDGGGIDVLEYVPSGGNRAPHGLGLGSFMNVASSLFSFQLLDSGDTSHIAMSYC
jgi:hypothetical protein